MAVSTWVSPTFPVSFTHPTVGIIQIQANLQKGVRKTKVYKLIPPQTGGGGGGGAVVPTTGQIWPRGTTSKTS